MVTRGEAASYREGLRNWWLFDEAWLEATLPGAGQTRWEGALSPLVLDMTPEGEWYLLGVAVAARALRDYKLPEHKRYVTFKLRDGTWQRIPFSEFPETFKPNLLANTSRLFESNDSLNGKLVDFETKRRVDSVPTLSPEFKRIDRLLGE